MKKLIQYRGRRIRYSSRNLLNFYKFFLLSPVLVLLGYFVGYKQIYLLVIKSVQKWQVYVLPVVFIMACLIGSLLLINLLIKWSIIRSGYFSKVEQRQILSRMLIDNNYYTKKQIKTSDGKLKEKIKFPKVYFKASKESVFVSFETSGNKFQEKFESIGGFLETAFHADNIATVDEKGFIIYELVVDVYEKRISIIDMKADKGKVQLMKGLYWYFDKDPHLLLGGGTGGGKTFTLLSLIYALCGIADIEICDPKNSDLMALGKLPLFSGKVHTGKEAITNCLKTGVELMNSRFEMMNNSPKESVKYFV